MYHIIRRPSSGRPSALTGRPEGTTLMPISILAWGANFGGRPEGTTLMPISILAWGANFGGRPEGTTEIYIYIYTCHIIRRPSSGRPSALTAAGTEGSKLYLRASRGRQKIYMYVISYGGPRRAALRHLPPLALKGASSTFGPRGAGIMSYGAFSGGANHRTLDQGVGGRCRRVRRRRG